jgi:NTP pyrophosphatase (non-canonical NTP hydrolase)
MKTLNELMDEVRDLNLRNGWRDPREVETVDPDGIPVGKALVHTSFVELMALITTECSEAVDAYRDHRLADATSVGKCAFGQCDNHPHKPEGVGSELADVFIRLLDVCDIFGIDLEAEYERKMSFNRTRPFRHGGKAL